MSRTCLVLPVLVCVLLAAVPAAAQLAPWWIPNDGCYLTVERDPGIILTVWGDAPLTLASSHLFLEITYEGYEYDGEGDLCLAHVSVAPPSKEAADLSTFTPPLKVLDLPLTTGKTWTSESYRSGGVGLPHTWILTATVVGPRTVDTPLGGMEVIEVLHETEVVGIGTTTRTLLLNETLGDVTGLLDESGCLVVGVEGASWGGLKARYR